ncbi:oligosaccharide flippase family protein [Comamonas thiooxydans]|uniref:oligosaccharide flippase family protein n=1 Tax=Comamonas thiooxydans TaxID=363952 RepID=UPI00093019B2|nr:oligosaccharide flippase family protein [Comamonas thiooxydans]
MKNFKNLIYLVCVQGANYVAPIAIMYILTKNASIEIYGRFAFWYAVLVYFQTIIDYGFNYTATREAAALDYKSENENLSKILCYVSFSKIIIAAFLLFAIFSSSIFFDFNLELAIIVFFGALFSSLVPNWFFQGTQNIKNISVFNIFGKLSFIIISFYFIENYSLENIFISYFLSASIPLIYSIIFFRKFKLIKHDYFNNVIRYIKDGRNIFSANVLAVLLSNGGVIFLGLFADDKILGIYSFCERIVKSFLGLFSPLFTAFYPVFSRKFALEFNNGLEFHRKFSIILFGSSITFLLFAYLIADFFFTENIHYDKRYFSILMIWVLVSLMNNAFGIQFLCASGNDRLYVKGMFSAFFVFLCFVGFNFFDNRGMQVALATCTSEFLLLLINIKYYLFVRNNNIQV